MTTPALLRLREAHPRAEIALGTPAKLAELWRSHPAVDRVLTFQAGESPWAVAARLRKETFDVALILPNSPRSAIECLLAGIPIRVGYRRPWRGWMLTQAIEPRSGSFSMHKPSPQEVRTRLQGASQRRNAIDAQAHHSLNYLCLVEALGAQRAPLAPRLHVTADEVREISERFGVNSGECWLGLNPGAEYGPAKRWPLERFASVAKTFSERSGARWLLFGGPKDAAMTAPIAAAVSGSKDLAGRTTLRELMALLSLCRVVLTNDTGPMHVAAALGVPVIVPFGSTSAELTGPGMPGDSRHRLLQAEVACAPCFLRECPVDFRCMNSISVESILAELDSAMGDRSRGSHRSV